MKINRLRPQDKGIYTCRIGNGKNQVESSGMLTVDAETYGEFISLIILSENKKNWINRKLQPKLSIGVLPESFDLSRDV